MLISVVSGGTFQKYSRLVISIEVHGEIVIGTQAMLVCTLAKEESQLEFVENFLVLL